MSLHPSISTLAADAVAAGRWHACPMTELASPPDWALDAVFYMVMPDRFARGPEAPVPWDAGALEPWDAPPQLSSYKGGDLRGLAARLDELRELGVDALLLTPVFHAVTSHRYKTLDHFAIDPLLGGDSAFDALVDAAHARGMRVVLDGVFNHVSTGFPAFQDVIANGEHSPWRRWFRIHGWPVKPWSTSQPANYACWNGNRSMPELDHENPAVRAYLGEVVEHWLRRGADGWRFDAPDRMRDPELWRELRHRARRVSPDAYLLGEIWGDASPWLDGTQWDGVTNYPLLYGLYRFVVGHRIRDEHLLPPSRGEPPIDAAGFARDLAAVLARGPWPTPLANMGFLSSHDVARFVTVSGDDRRSLELAALLLFTLPGVPCIYYGDEVGMRGGLSPASRGGYPPPARWDVTLRDFFRGLAALRHAHEPLRRGGYRTLHAEDGLLVFERITASARVLVAVNAGDAPARCVLALGPAGPAATVHGTAAVKPVPGEGGAWSVTLAARGGAVFRCDR